MPWYPQIEQQQQGGGPPPAAQMIASQPVPTPAPPVTSSAPEVIQAEQDVAKANLLKKSIKNTIMAGDTGGFGMGQPGSPGMPLRPPQTTFKRQF